MTSHWTVPESLILTSFDRQSLLHHVLTEKVTTTHQKPIESLPTLPALKLPGGQTNDAPHVQIGVPNFEKRRMDTLELLDLHNFLFTQNTCGQEKINHQEQEKDKSSEQGVFIDGLRKDFALPLKRDRELLETFEQQITMIQPQKHPRLSSDNTSIHEPQSKIEPFSSKRENSETSSALDRIQKTPEASRSLTTLLPFINSNFKPS